MMYRTASEMHAFRYKIVEMTDWEEAVWFIGSLLNIMVSG
jgi:hypothetical protein